MKNKIDTLSKKLLFIFLIFLSGVIHGQLVTEKIGGISTSFIVKSDSILLNNTKQLLIKRGAYDHSKYTSTGENQSFGYGYGYGYESYHIEFTSSQKIHTAKFSKKRKRKKIYFKLSLIEDSGINYTNIKIRSSEVKLIMGKKGNEIYYTYSINLNCIPLINLDNIVEFNIVRIEE